MTSTTKIIRWSLLTASGAVLVSGCMMKPSQTPQLERELQKQGAPYAKPFAQRTLPELATPATWQDVLQRAFLANGELEASYHEWRAAMERISMASYWPNSNVSLGFEYMFSKESLKTWDRVTVTSGFDQAAPLTSIPKVKKGGQIALENANQAAQTFRSNKFRIQKQVLNAYFDLALMEEQIRIEQDNGQLLRTMLDNARSRVAAGGAQQDMYKAQLAVRVSENDLKTMQSQAHAMRAMLNGMMNRNPDAAIVLPAQLPPARAILADDDALIAMGVDRNPELARLAAQVQGRADAIELAKMQYIPDISPTAAINGSISRTLGAMITVPTTIPIINASIREAKAMREASEAMLRQTRQEKAAGFVATLYAMRNAEREETFFNEQVLPLSREVVKTSRQDYIAGRVGLVEMIDSQRMLLEVHRSTAQMRMDREKRLAELEELAGVDVEVLGRPATTMPATMPATVPAPVQVNSN